MRKPITRKFGLKLYNSSYRHVGVPFLCLSELRQYVDLPSRAPRDAVLTLTNEKPKGSNYHTFRWSRSQRQWTMRGVEGGSPGLYYSLTGRFTYLFKKSHTIYAWISC